MGDAPRGDRGVRWGDLTSPELHAAFDGGGQVGLLPIGAIEQHGPHLPLATDAIIATALSERAAGRSGAIVLPTISLGNSYGHGVAFPGTVSLSPELLGTLIRQCVEWAAASGLAKVLCVNAHMGNSAAIQTAIDHLRLFRPDVQCGAIDWWQATAQVAALTVEDGADLHANRAETSLMLALAPERVRTDLLGSADDPDRTGDLVFRYTAPALSHNGVTGRPSAATRELGERLLEGIVAEISVRVGRGRTEVPPLGRAAPPPFTHRAHAKGAPE